MGAVAKVVKVVGKVGGAIVKVAKPIGTVAQAYLATSYAIKAIKGGNAKTAISSVNPENQVAVAPPQQSQDQYRDILETERQRNSIQQSQEQYARGLTAYIAKLNAIAPSYVNRHRSDLTKGYSTYYDKLTK